MIDYRTFSLAISSKPNEYFHFHMTGFTYWIELYWLTLLDPSGQRLAVRLQNVCDLIHQDTSIKLLKLAGTEKRLQLTPCNLK
jgi:hypothetical protein